MVMVLLIVSMSIFLLIFEYFVIKILSKLILFPFKRFSTIKFMLLFLQDAKDALNVNLCYFFLQDAKDALNVKTF